MAQDWDDRDRPGRDYGRSGTAGGGRTRFGGDDDNRRYMDDSYGDERGGRHGRFEGRGRSGGGYGGGYGGGAMGGSARGSFDTRHDDMHHDDDYGRGNLYDPISSGMAGRGMGMTGASFGTASGFDSRGGGYGGRSYEQNSRNRSERGFVERAGDEVASWFGDNDAQRRREADEGHRGRGPKNYNRSDDRIREDVSDRLSDDRHIDASDIDVSVSAGEVTLDGTVDSRMAKRHAEDIAEDCSGVKHVQNNLRIKSRVTGGGMSGNPGETDASGMIGSAMRQSQDDTGSRDRTSGKA